MSLPNTSEKPTTKPWILFLAWAVVAIIWACSGMLLQEVDQRGTFGDMFGAVNALFSGLALATLFYAAWLQREELVSTKTELELQRRMQEEQSHTLALQRFESTFFELLRVHGQIVDSIDLVNDAGHVTRSRDCFKVFHKRLAEAHAKYAAYPDPENPLGTVQYIYEKFCEKNLSEVGHYFRHLYHIIKFVSQAPINERRRYTSLVRAQLSSYEQALLFYNGLSEYGYAKFKPLIEEFALLENLPRKLLLERELHLKLYRNDAYGEDGPF